VNSWYNVFEVCFLRRVEVSQRGSTLFRRFSAVAAGAANRRRWHPKEGREVSAQPTYSDWAMTVVELRGLGFQIVAAGLSAQEQVAGVFEGLEPTERR
jgi:hypothetical protein